MLSFNIHYKFKNGVTCDYTICKDKCDLIAKVEWSCEINKKNLAPIIDEYRLKCVPFVYQQIADFIGEPILWVDSHTLEKQTFLPSILVSN